MLFVGHRRTRHDLIKRVPIKPQANKLKQCGKLGVSVLFKALILGRLESPRRPPLTLFFFFFFPPPCHYVLRLHWSSSSFSGQLGHMLRDLACLHLFLVLMTSIKIIYLCSRIKGTLIKNSLVEMLCIWLSCMVKFNFFFSVSTCGEKCSLAFKKEEKKFFVFFLSPQCHSVMTYYLKEDDHFGLVVSLTTIVVNLFGYTNV